MFLRRFHIIYVIAKADPLQKGNVKPVLFPKPRMKLQVFLFFVVVLAALVSVAVGMPQRGGGRGRGRGRGGPGNRLDTCITSRRINRDSVFYLLDEGDEECEDGLPESGTSLIVGSLADECAVRLLEDVFQTTHLVHLPFVNEKFNKSPRCFKPRLHCQTGEQIL